MKSPTVRDTPPAEFIGYAVAVTLIIGIGALFQGPILNFIFGPACVIACVAVAMAVDRRWADRRRRR